MKTDVTIPWADGTYRFHLDVPRLVELQDKCDAGPPEILGRLSSGRAKIQDWRETIRLGLIGGGTSPSEALRLVSAYVDAQPMIGSIGVAVLVLGAALLGHVPEGAPGEQDRAMATPETDASTSPASEQTPS